MIFIQPTVQRISQEPNLDGIYKQIELGGRTAYKSEDKITEDSATTFVKRIINLEHSSVLEHGTVYLFYNINLENFNINNSILDRYQANPFSRYKITIYNNEINLYITTNYRVIVENGWEDDLIYLSEPLEHHIKRHSLKIICDRSISHQIVRHRGLSVTQESQRYCNYSKNKFNNNVTFIIPSNFPLIEGEYILEDNTYQIKTNENAERISAKNEVFGYLLDMCYQAEKYYFQALEKGLTPQIARKILPNATKTELFITGYQDDWEHFLKLRESRNADPDMINIAKMIRQNLNIDINNESR